jgi:hypothetical protein
MVAPELGIFGLCVVTGVERCNVRESACCSCAFQPLEKGVGVRCKGLARILLLMQLLPRWVFLCHVVRNGVNFLWKGVYIYILPRFWDEEGFPEDSQQ